MSTYYNFKVLKFNVLAVCFLVFFSVFSTTKTYATDYYITPRSEGGVNRSILPINSGIAARDNATGSGYILYSEESLFTRFAASQPHRDNSDHLIAVQFTGGVWKYDPNAALLAFTPRAGDVLIAEVDFSNDTITGLQGVNNIENGITKGYTSGDLTFTANRWEGGFNIGEFTVGGTSFVTNGGGSNWNSGTSQSAPWATFAHAMDQISAGDTLYLMDGTYREHMIIDDIAGSAGNPITIKALNDGQAIVDGGYSRGTLRVGDGTSNNPANVHHITIEGIVFKDPKNNYNVGDWLANAIYCKADNIIFRRVSAYNGDTGIQLTRSNDILLEDCVSTGGRKGASAFNCNRVTWRRSYIQGLDLYATPQPKTILSLYLSNDCVVENCFFTRDGSAVHYQGVTVNANADSGLGPTNGNKLYGNVFFGLITNIFWIGSNKVNIQDNALYHNVGIGIKNGVVQRSDDNFVIENLVITQTTKGGQCIVVQDIHCDWDGCPDAGSCEEAVNWCLDNDFAYNGVVKNSVLMNSSANGLSLRTDLHNSYYTNTYNNYWNNVNNWSGAASQGTGEVTINPNYNTTTFGNGAYLMYPDALKGLGEGGANIGAEVLYRYEGGVLTTTPLWPWPMEDRIFAETGISVTWEANGGLWKTLDGVYSAGDNISAPKGLRIQ